MESLTDEQRALFADGGQLDDYEVLKPIGKGKFSVVLKATRRRDNQAVALKKIAIFDMMNLKAREKTLKEVRLVQSVCHPNIIQYLDAFVQNNELYIAFEWAEAGDLKRQIRKANEKGVRFDERTIWRYFTQLCGAILYLHQNRIMHRDLKPANIFLTLKGVVKVGDLGLGRYLSENTVEARSKVGTPLYMSPEVLRGESYDWKSDVWSMGCILYELAMLRSPFKSEGLNLVGLFQKINKGYYEAIPEVYSDHLRGLVKRMISLTSSDRPSMEEVWEYCRTRPTSGALQERMRRHQASTENNNESVNKDPERSTQLRNSRRKPVPENETPSRPSSSDQQETPPQSRPPSSQGNANSGATDEMIRRRHAEARAELLYERLKILEYEKVLKKRVSPAHFACDGRALPRVTPQSRFEDMCTLSRWLISLLGNEEWTNDDENNDPPVVAAQKILLAAEKAGVSVVTHLSAAALTSGAGVEVCELLDALSAAVVCDEKYCTTPPEYPNEPVETLESCDELDVTDDEQHSTTDTGELTTTLEYDGDEAFSRWVVVKEENQIVDDDKENVMIHTDIDPVAWELERRRMLPKLHAVFHDKLQLRPTESSWRVRLDLIQDRSGSIVAGQEGLRCEIAQVQASRQKQADQLERYEKQLNHHFLRSRRLYHENTARLVKTHSEMQSVQENVNRATIELARLQAARSEQAKALKEAEARITDNSILLERKRQLRHLIDENKDIDMNLQVLHDYWTRKQQHALQCSHLAV